jgi:hypothetical protein
MAKPEFMLIAQIGGIRTRMQPLNRPISAPKELDPEADIR